jgi:L-2-hydroxyglutarate oxidase LhgO
LGVECSRLNVFPAVKTISPGSTLRSNRDKWGMGVRQALFPVPAFGAPFSGAAGFPTPFSTASGVIGLVAGPSAAFRRCGF